MNPEPTLRTFIAIELNPKLQSLLHQIQEDLKKMGADIRWVKPENIHVTLKFLGEIPPAKIDELRDVMIKTLEPVRPFSLGLTHLGAFPKIENPQIIWVGATADRNSIQLIAQSLEKNLMDIGFEKEERDFDPHITLGRMRTSVNKFALTKKLKHFEFPATPLHQLVNQIVLFKSSLSPQGPAYEALAKIDLGGQ